MVDDRVTEEGCPRDLGEGRFLLHDCIGQGGSGTVYRATGPNGPCAVKLRPVPERQIQAARFLVEPVPMAQVRHPRIVRVLDTGRDGSFYWIAMSLYENGTIADLVQGQGALPIDDALKLTEQTLEGLGAVHEAGFVHRDIKPHNIFVDQAGGAVVGDFGVARHVNAKLWFRTRTGQGIGTMGYRAPEQDQDAKSAGPPADVYGAAATLFFMLVGRRPPLLYAAEANQAVLDPLPVDLRELVFDASRHEVADRIQTAAEFYKRVRKLRNQMRMDVGEPVLEEAQKEGGGVAAWFKRIFTG